MKDQLEHGLPAAFVDRCRAIVPEAEWPDFLASFRQPRACAARGNTLRTSPETARARLRADGLAATPLSGLPEALIVPAGQRATLLAHPLVAAGDLYTQGVASQLATLALDPQPGETALDLCAAPGGKTAHIACRMAAQGRIIAIEAVKKRFFKLRGNLERQGLACVETRCMDGRAAWRCLAEACDRVMVDAPCSSEARFRAGEPETFRYWSPRKIGEMRRKQKGLIRAGIRCLKPGGALLYATCSFAPEENESVVHDALRVFGDAIEIVPLRLPGWVSAQPGLTEWRGRAFHPDVQRARRILPDARTSGFFLCLLRRRP